ncbi:proline-rich protein 5-like isoform X3 [Scophthalmus maximus]|uniref:proline-rich protein 5-like isoform X3 n=1 Tax=Scophthalmus maximus TaxID=52904 RepID=UPI001FA8316F|nr:proline-rich protein 5-like isoform X3 [Scophthalmus maximus]
MGSFRRPRPRFMSSPVLSDLARFHASSPSLQVSNSSVWNRINKAEKIVQSAVIKVFQGGALQTNELFTLNESIRWLLKTEMGSFITDYFQNQLLTRGLSDVLDQILLHSGDARLVVLGDVWDRFFTETLPTLQAIFYPVQGQELTVRQMALLAFRDLVLLKLHLEETLGAAASVPLSVTQMLLVLQSPVTCGCRGRCQATSPRSPSRSITARRLWRRWWSRRARPTWRRPVACGATRWPTRTLTSGCCCRRRAGCMQKGEGGGPMCPRTFSSQLDVEDSPRGGVIGLPHS